jgi:ribonuclease HII
MANLLSNYHINTIEAGCDEAGRGCLAGPVVAAAVILPNDFHHPLLDDSKKLTEKQRDMLRPVIESEAISFAVSFISPQEIDKINILNASILGMHKAIDQLTVRPELLLIDGNRFKPYESIEHVCIIKGDGKFKSIAAASVLAKTYRDEYMMELHTEFPAYNWKKNKGYPTKDHREAIQLNGETPHHRLTFRLLSESQLTLFD